MELFGWPRLGSDDANGVIALLSICLTGDWEDEVVLSCESKSGTNCLAPSGCVADRHQRMRWQERGSGNRQSNVQRQAVALRFGHPPDYGERGTFGSSGTKQRYLGTIEPDGTYAILDVPQGKMKVGVISRDPSKPSEQKKEEPAPTPVEGWFPIPNKYETPAEPT